MTINKLELCNKFREITQCTHADARFVVDTLTSIIIEELSQNHRVMLGKIGTLSVMRRKARRGFNPTTRGLITIPERPAIKITPSIMMKKLLIEKLG